MGFIDNIRGFFSNSNSTQSSQPQVNEEYEKSMLADKIVDLVNKIKKIDSFDSSIWSLHNASSSSLKRKSLNELRSLYSSLGNRLSELNMHSQLSNSRRESLESSKWTGQRPNHMTSRDFDRFQRDDDGR